MLYISNTAEATSLLLKIYPFLVLNFELHVKYHSVIFTRSLKPSYKYSIFSRKHFCSLKCVLKTKNALKLRRAKGFSVTHIKRRLQIYESPLHKKDCLVLSDNKRIKLIRFIQLHITETSTDTIFTFSIGTYVISIRS
jgi:hypothetical protein